MKYTTILFDADDTLLDFKRSEHDAITHVLSDMGLQWDEKTISVYSKINDSLWKLLEKGGITKDELKVERFKKLCDHFGFSADPAEMANKYIIALSEQAHIIPNADTVCQRLYEAGFDMYIVTNGIKFIQTRRFNASPLPRFFKKIFISEEMGYEKPRKEFFDNAALKIDAFDPTRTLIIGDSLSSDIKGGINAGIDTCWYNPGYKVRPEGFNITFEIHTLEDILPILGIL